MNEETEKLKNLLAKKFSIQEKRTRLKELEFIVSDSDIWKEDRGSADSGRRKRAEAEAKIKEYGLLRSELEYFNAIETPEDAYRFEEKFIAKNKYENLPAIISVLPGAGGEDAADWANMLLTMYGNYAAKRGWKVLRIDKDTIEVKGEDAYNILRKEYGVHRLVRVSPYDAKKLRHTSFALVEILPALEELDAEGVKIPEKDIRLDFTRSSGPGGQSVNKVETSVRAVHIPTGLSASSQVERSQARNRARAIIILKAKLIKLLEEKHETEIASLKTRVNPEWGRQIRSYVMHPYKLVKDHRTGHETAKIDDILAGNLDGFIEAELELQG